MKSNSNDVITIIMQRIIKNDGELLFVMGLFVVVVFFNSLFPQLQGRKGFHMEYK